MNYRQGPDLNPDTTAVNLAAEDDFFARLDSLDIDATYEENDDLSFPAAPRMPSIPGFEPRGLIARGGSGDVFRARDPKIAREVALKFVRPGSDEHTFRLVSEAQRLGKFRHPNIVQIYQVVHASDTQVCLVMELVDGVTLAEWLETPRRPRDILRRMVEVGRALTAAHSVGIIHRDLKPQNIMIDECGQAKLIDFGLADAVRHPWDSLSAPTSLLVGTRDYIAPEHRRGGTCSIHSDQYSFCVVVHEALYGKKPARGRRRRLRLPAHPCVPRSVRRALQRGLDEDPERRWPAMDPLLRALIVGPWWQHPPTRRLLLALVTVLVLGVCGLFASREARIEREAHARECVFELRERRLEVERLAAARSVGVASTAAADDESLCRDHHVADDPAAAAAVAAQRECLELYAEALTSHLRRPPSGRPHSLPISAHALVPPLPSCPMIPETMRGDPLRKKIVVDLLELRLLAQEQRFDEARVLLQTGLLPALMLRRGPLLAEALLFAGQVARRTPIGKDSVRIHDMDAEELLNLAEIHADRAHARLLMAHIQLERINLALDGNDMKTARLVLDRVEPLDGAAHTALRVRRLQTEARIAAKSRDYRGGLRRLLAAGLELFRDPTLIHTTLPTELVSTAALYSQSIDVHRAHDLHRIATALSRSMLGPEHYLTGVVAENAMKNAFVVGAVTDAEHWGDEAVHAFSHALGGRSIAVQRIEYDIALALQNAGESARARRHARMADTLARDLGLDAEFPFTLYLMAVVEQRQAQPEALHLIHAAQASYPPSLRSRPEFVPMLAVAALDIEADRRVTLDLASRARALQASFDRPDSPALGETRVELRYVRAKILAALGRTADALGQLRPLTKKQIDESPDPWIRAELYWLRGRLLTDHGEDVAAQNDACRSMMIFRTLGNDGDRRLAALSTRGHSATFAACPGVNSTPERRGHLQ